MQMSKGFGGGPTPMQPMATAFQPVRSGSPPEAPAKPANAMDALTDLGGLSLNESAKPKPAPKQQQQAPIGAVAFNATGAIGHSSGDPFASLNSF